MIHTCVVRISLAKETFSDSLHFGVLFLRGKAECLVIKGFDKGVELEQFCHV